MSDPLPLRDIHLPDGVDWFPPAPGWWLLAIVLLVILVLLRWLRRRSRRYKVHKGAGVEIEALLAAYDRDGDALKLLQQLSVLFKRIGLTYLDRDQVAGMSGSAWIEKVDELAGGRRFSAEVRELLATAPYRAHLDADDKLLQELISQIRRWSADLPSRVRSATHV